MTNSTDRKAREAKRDEFINIMIELIEKYGEEVIAKIENENKDTAKTA
ncbi:hypothetical protein [Serpentinicella alkaliphila]|uniref:Uncharacterized protein n=1 Tax=Serpentinicella alkaliphila TaxID=1734049 RepID=A0A4R2TVJ0_9FIRM|nr:hypothetical protein [Serpentinicella alkaliphila]QUH25207.1 hypothetical protein HZR23_05145 [Serpentinicella alkaliphila]TCQ07017.1 hypothetical protein EDD79_100213 [Serpentinicella alkaliphila]